MQTKIVNEKKGFALAINKFSIDEIGIKERASFFTKRSIKKESKLQALYMAIQMCDLTTLEGADSPSKIEQLCQKAKNPAPHYLNQELLKQKKLEPIPSVAAVCVYPSMVSLASQHLKGTNIAIASVATAFPSGQLPLSLKLEEVRFAISKGATEIDMVINRGAFLSGRYQEVFDEIQKIKELCDEEVHLKVILETGEIGSYDNIRLASDIAIEAGADFIKTSTGKIAQAANMPVTLVMLNAIKDYYLKTGKKIGMKPAGGIRTAKEAIHYLCMVNETLGEDWLDPKLFRFGASSLVNDLLKQIYKEATGRYYYDKSFSID